MTNSKRVLVSAAVTAISTLVLAQAGGGTGGARDNSAAIITGTGGQTVRGDETSPGGARRDVPWEGSDAGGLRQSDTTVGVPDPNTGRVPQVGGPAIDVLPSQQRLTVGQTPTTQPIGQMTPTPAPVAGGNVTGRLDTSAGTGGVTSSSSGTAGSVTGTGPIQQAPGVAAPGTPPVVGAPSGFLQQQAAGTTPEPVRGGFGSSDTGASATTGQPASAVDASQIDVTRRTQELSQQSQDAQTAGGTLAPGQATTRPAQQGQQGRPSIPMPAPQQASPAGGFGNTGPTNP